MTKSEGFHGFRSLVYRWFFQPPSPGGARGDWDAMPKGRARPRRATIPWTRRSPTTQTLKVACPKWRCPIGHGGAPIVGGFIMENTTKMENTPWIGKLPNVDIGWDGRAPRNKTDDQMEKTLSWTSLVIFPVASIDLDFWWHAWPGQKVWWGLSLWIIQHDFPI